MAKPHTFPVFKVAKSSLEFIRFEAEIDNYGSMNAVLTKLDMKAIKLSGFAEQLKVIVASVSPTKGSIGDASDVMYRASHVLVDLGWVD